MQELDSILKRATAAIPREYFKLPVAEKDDIYRERVYTYELYHQLRTIWPPATSYSLSGEVDKAGHPIIRGKELGGTKPDLLVHTPGNMDRNYLVMEVKPINSQKAGIKKDLRTLTAYRRHAKYQRAILLIYGSDGVRQLGNFIRAVKSFKALDVENLIDLALIEIWHHSAYSQEAASVLAQQ